MKKKNINIKTKAVASLVLQWEPSLSVKVGWVDEQKDFEFNV